METGKRLALSNRQDTQRHEDYGAQTNGQPDIDQPCY